MFPIEHPGIMAEFSAFKSGPHDIRTFSSRFSQAIRRLKLHHAVVNRREPAEFAFGLTEK